MKNPLEGLFSKTKKKSKDAALAAAFTASVLGANAAENPTQPVKDADLAKTESIQAQATQEKSADTVSLADYEAEKALMAKMDTLRQEITAHKTNIQQLTGYLQGVQTDFQNNYRSALTFKEGEKAKSHLAGFDEKLADLAMKMGQEKVAKFDITSEQAVNGLLGILLSGGKDSPFEKEATYLAQFTQGQLGSTMATGGVNFASRGYKSPDMQIHEQLGKDPRIIVETALKIVKEQHELQKVQAEYDSLVASSSTASN